MTLDGDGGRALTFSAHLKVMTHQAALSRSVNTDCGQARRDRAGWPGR